MSGDISDQASDRELFDTELAVKYQREQNKPIKYTGRCLYCNEQITIGRYCSAECREDGESEAAIRARQFR
jgi:hypothetical protein